MSLILGSLWANLGFEFFNLDKVICFSVSQNQELGENNRLHRVDLEFWGKMRGDGALFGRRRRGEGGVMYQGKKRGDGRCLDGGGEMRMGLCTINLDAISGISVG